jgi:hypothetical protein
LGFHGVVAGQSRSGKENRGKAALHKRVQRLANYRCFVVHRFRHNLPERIISMHAADKSGKEKIDGFLSRQSISG